MQEEYRGLQTGNWLLPVLVALIGAFMALLDSSIVNVALPTMMRVFNTDTSTISWVVTGYMLALGVVVPLSGWLGDRLGLKLLYMLSLGIFTLGSLLCAWSVGVGTMIAARVIQALGGGMLMPTTMSIIYSLVPQDRLGRAMGVFGIALIVAPAIGPTLGGYLVEYVDWRWIFTINLPIGVLGLFLSWFYLPLFPRRDPGPLDLGGALTSAAGLFCLLLALSKGNEWGWTSEAVVLLLYTSSVALGLFVYLELVTENPLLDLRVFRFPVFSWGNLILIIISIAMFGGIFYITFFLQIARGLGPMETGLITMPAALASGIMMPLAGWLYDRIGPKIPTMLGLLWVAVTTYMLKSLDVDTPTSTIYLLLIMRAMGMPFAMMPAQTAALSVIPPALIGRASAITNIISRVSASFGIALLTSVMNNRMALHAARYREALTWDNLGLQFFFQQADALLKIWGQGKLLAQFYLQSLLAKYAFVRAIGDVFIITAGITLLALVPALFLYKGEAEGRGPLGWE